MWLLALATAASAVVALARGFSWAVSELDRIDYTFDEDDGNLAATISTDRGGRDGA
jgi:hypothetical protein